MKDSFLRSLLAACLSCTMVAGPTAILADDDDSDFVPLAEMKPLERTKGFKNRHTFHYGVSASNTLINETQIPIIPSSKQVNDLRAGFFVGNYRPFLKYQWNEQHTFNARARIAYKYNPSLTDDGKKNGAVVSAAEYNMELLNAELDFDKHRVTAGRAFYRMGRGLLFANFADGAEYTGDFKFGRIKALGIYSGQYAGCTISISGCGTNGDIALKGAYDIVPGRPIDAAVPDPGRRFFVGTEYQTPQLFGTNIYAMVLYSRDMSRDPSVKTGTDNGKQYAFDPFYLGAGFSGYIVTPRLRYLTEGILQRGNTYNKNTTGDSTKNVQSTIEAWAVTADLNYSLPFYEHLVKAGLVAQYGYGSGRDSKTPNPSNPSQENTGPVDNNFYSFGVYSAGLAFKPRLSNLHIIRVGTQFRPLHYFYWGRNFMLSMKYTFYMKGNADYGISDTDAQVSNRDVGRGIDIQSVWDLRSDLKFFYAYGYFTPGSAYKEADAKNIHSHILSINFLF